jgi:peptide methionine sulfoxide reductase msrA/msrB
MNSNISINEKAIFAAGCFWGVEHYFQKVTGVISTMVGYTGGKTENPSYNEVCSGKTDHAEAIEVIYDPAKTSFETLAKQFFEIHNPALIVSKSNEKRSQYRSAIFYLNEEQKTIAKKLVSLLIEKKYEVATEITEAENFYEAEEYHQGYYNKKGRDDYGNRYKKKFD